MENILIEYNNNITIIYVSQRLFINLVLHGDVRIVFLPNYTHKNLTSCSKSAVNKLCWLCLSQVVNKFGTG